MSDKNLDHIKTLAAELVATAKNHGHVVTITPLAMGHDMVVDVRPGRGMLLPSPPPERLDDREFSELLAKAEAIVVQHQRGSISLVQRNLKISYNLATKLIEALEKKGVLSVSNNGGIRTVLKGRGA